MKESKYKTLFLTLTFPAFRKKHNLTKIFFYDEISNILFSRFVENIRRNYNCTGYLAVKEYGENTQRVHFHILISLPYIDILHLNNIWVNTIQDYCYSSRCAIRSKSGQKVIHSVGRAIRYVCKYISKQYGARSDTRIIFISNNLLSQLVTINKKRYITDIKTLQVKEESYTEQFRQSNITYTIKDRTFNINTLMQGYKSIQIQTFDYVTVFKVTDAKEFNKFCNNLLYPIFSASMIKTEFHRAITEISQ